MPTQTEQTPACCHCRIRIYPSDRRVTLTFCSLSCYERWVENLKAKG